VLGSALGATASAVGDVDWSRRTAIVLGNEAEGLSDEMLACCDATFHIPMAGACSSNAVVIDSLCSNCSLACKLCCIA
jgi:tRNA G18 (ribose-2'-O)-methylase SpoU